MLEDDGSDEKAVDGGSEKEDAAAEESLAEKMLGGDASGNTSEDEGEGAGGQG